MPKKTIPKSYDSFDRMLAYNDKHAGWIVFRSIYWSMYLLMVGFTLLWYSLQNMQLSLQLFVGYAFSIAAIMMIVYGFAETLHHKLMRKYA